MTELEPIQRELAQRIMTAARAGDGARLRDLVLCEVARQVEAALKAQADRQEAAAPVAAPRVALPAARLLPEEVMQELGELAGRHPAVLVPSETVRALLQTVQILGDALVEEGAELFCRGCGCGTSRACEGGCWWAEEGLCNRCASQADIELPLDEDQRLRLVPR